MELRAVVDCSDACVVDSGRLSSYMAVSRVDAVHV